MYGYSPVVPLKINKQDGIGLTKTYEEVAKQNLLMVVMTNPGERIMFPEFGVGLKRLLFEQSDTGIKADIIASIKSQANIYLPYIIINDVMAVTIKPLYKAPIIFFDDPSLVWEWYEDRRKNILSAKPNEGHFAIANMEKFRDVVVLTQNIDGLHQRSGSTNVLELHGSIIRIKCTHCSFSDNITDNFESLPPKCTCGNILRPDVVWFGEALPQDVWKNAMEEASRCDIMIIAGTSLVVSPANTLPIYAKQNGATLIEVNPEKTMMSNDMDLSIQDTSATILPKILSVLKNE